MQEPLSYQQIALVVTVQGNVDKLAVRQFERQFQDYFNVGYYFIIFDCSGLKYISSSGLQVLLKTVEMYHKAGGIFLFIKVLSQIGKFFDILGFTPIFTSFSTKEEAITYLEEQLQKSITEEQKKELAAAQPPAEEATKAASTTELPSSSQQQMRPPATPLAINRGKPVTPKPLATSGKHAGLELGLDVQTPKRMKKNKLYPILLYISKIQGHRDPPILNVVPYFPGCLVVPEYRAIYLATGQQTTFWITPLVKQDIPGWLEIWCGEENIQQWIMPISIVTQLIPLMLFIVASLAAGACWGIPFGCQWMGAQTPEFLVAINTFIQTIQLWGYLGSALVAFLGLVVYIQNHWTSLVTMQQKFIFEA